jgi:virulence-associated protein VapD
MQLIDNPKKSSKGLSLSDVGVNLDLPPEGNTRMYAIAFDLDTDTLAKTYGTSHTNAYTEIHNFLKSRGFEWKQGSLYFGNPEVVNAVTCVVAVSELTREFDWFAPSVRDIRMLRIEDTNDLQPAIQLVLQQRPASAQP